MSVDWTTEHGPELNTFAMVRSGASDATVAVAFYNAYGELVPVSGSAGEISLVVGSTARSLPRAMIAVGHTSIPGQPPGTIGDHSTKATYARLRVLAGAICCNYAGTRDGSAGAGNGFSDADKAPTESSATRLVAGEEALIGKVPPL